MEKISNCWTCKHLFSALFGLPPIFCRAYPDGDGIPFSVISGKFSHNHLFGDEKEKVFYEQEKERRT